MKEIARGAEAVLLKDDGRLIKKRKSKEYRIRELDEKIRKKRTKRESKLLTRSRRFGILTPQVRETDTESKKIEMDFLEGKVVRDILDEEEERNEISKKVEELARKIGSYVGKLHEGEIIHSDLTTSNMILVEGELYFIDFGLAYTSNKVEDKATDLHLLKRALIAKHAKIWEEIFKKVTDSYLNHSKRGKKVLERVKDIERRGRYKSH